MGSACGTRRGPSAHRVAEDHVRSRGGTLTAAASQPRWHPAFSRRQCSWEDELLEHRSLRRARRPLARERQLNVSVRWQSGCPSSLLVGFAHLVPRRGWHPLKHEVDVELIGGEPFVVVREIPGIRSSMDPKRRAIREVENHGFAAGGSAPVSSGIRTPPWRRSFLRCEGAGRSSSGRRLVQRSREDPASRSDAFPPFLPSYRAPSRETREARVALRPTARGPAVLLECQ